MYARQINNVWAEVVGRNVFSPTVYQTPESLTDEQRAEFGLYLIVEMPRPVLTATQKLGEPSYQINGTTVERSYPAVSKSAEELAADAQALQDGIVAATQQRLDDFARTRNYDGILSACTYASSTVPKFAAEGQYAVNARDNTWATLYTLMEDVMAGQWQAPESFDDVEPLLPQLTWPV